MKLVDKQFDWIGLWRTESYCRLRIYGHIDTEKRDSRYHHTVVLLTDLGRSGQDTGRSITNDCELVITEVNKKELAQFGFDPLETYWIEHYLETTYLQLPEVFALISAKWVSTNGGPPKVNSVRWKYVTREWVEELTGETIDA